MGRPRGVLCPLSIVLCSLGLRWIGGRSLDVVPYRKPGTRDERQGTKDQGPTTKDSPGFTLIEVLVALTLLGVISAVLAAAFSVSLRAFAVIRQRSDVADARRVLTQRLRSDLEGVWLRPGSRTTWFRGASPAAAGTTSVSLPQGAVLSLTTSRPVALEAVRTDEGIGGQEGPQSGVAQVTWWLETAPDGTLELVRRERTPPDTDVDETQDPAVDRTILARGIRELRIRFFDGVEWWEEWGAGGEDEEAETAGLPRAVEVTLWLEPNAAAAPPAPRFSASAPDPSAPMETPAWSLVVALPEPVDAPE